MLRVNQKKKKKILCIFHPSLLVAEPDCFFQGHDGPAYDVKFYGDGEDALLIRFFAICSLCFAHVRKTL